MSTKKMCQGKCNKEKDAQKQFYNTNNKMFSDGKSPVCKSCIQEMIDFNDMRTVYDILRQFDIPFIKKYWIPAENSKKNTFGEYMRMAGTLHQFVNTTWEDSVFEDGELEINQKEINDDPSKNVTISRSKFVVTDEIIDKWGDNYTQEEYQNFEKKYDRLIKNYGEKTALHTEGLLSYIRFRVKEEMATARGNVKEAKEWGSLASNAAKDAKINVSQLSKSDISGGVDVLSQLFEAVETEIGIIPLLPRVLAQPYDDADLIIWAIINYYRRLEDKQKVAYKDIYSFYDEMLEEHFFSKGFNEEEVENFKAKRNNIFRDLEKVYIEPLYDTGEDE